MNLTSSRRSTALVCGIGLLLLGVSGCGGGADGLMADQIAVKNEAATILDGVKDEATASEAVTKLDPLVKRAEANDKKMAELKLSTDDVKKLLEKNKAGMEAANKKFSESLAKAMKSAGPKGLELMKPTMSIQMAGAGAVLSGALGDMMKGLGK